MLGGIQAAPANFLPFLLPLPLHAQTPAHLHSPGTPSPPSPIPCCEMVIMASTLQMTFGSENRWGEVAGKGPKDRIRLRWQEAE
jgi:hypothetical protein